MATGITAAFRARGLSPAAALPSVLVAYALSTVLTGALFYLTGWLQLGHVLSYVPRHIIVGFIGGFGGESLSLLATVFQPSTYILYCMIVGTLRLTLSCSVHAWRGHTNQRYMYILACCAGIGQLQTCCSV
jgi:Sulfate permease family